MIRSELEPIMKKMEENKRLNPKEKDVAISILKEQLAGHEKHGRNLFAEKCRDSIEKIEGYKPKRYKLTKRQSSRSLGEITKDIEAATELIRRYNMSRNYDAATAWLRNRAELEKEFYAALSGEVYSPEMENTEGFEEWLYRGGFGRDAI